MIQKIKSTFSSFTGSKTLRRYLISYMVTLVFMLLGFLFLIQFPLSRSYKQNLLEQTGEHLSALGEQVDSALTGIVQTHQSISGNINLILPLYDNSAWAQYEAFHTLENYAIANPYINSIVMVEENGQITSTGVLVTYDEDADTYSLHADTKTASFQGSALEDPSNPLFFTTDESGRIYLLYSPAAIAGSLRVIYVLDTNELSSLLHTLVGGEITDALLLSPDGANMVSAAGNTAFAVPEGTVFDGTETSRRLENGHYLSWKSLTSTDFKIAAEVSWDFYNETMHSVFQKTYLLLLIIGIIGFIISCLAMRSTFRPLRELTEKIAPVSTISDNYLEQIDQAFTDSEDQNQQLQSKISHYRALMQSNILSSISSVFPESSFPEGSSDDFFSEDPDNQIYALWAAAKDRALLGDVVSQLRSALPAKSSCVVMAEDEGGFTLVICYPGMEPQKDDILYMICGEIQEALQVPLAISDSSSSPLDIPTLCEQAALAGTYLTAQSPVLTYHECALQPAAKPVRTYPYDQIRILQRDLDAHQFTAAQAAIDELFAQLDSDIPRNSVPDYYIHCVLFDILGALVRSMGESDVKYRQYSDLYMETLYYCQSFPFSEKREEIHGGINALLAVYREDLENRTINIEKIKDVIGENYASPDFSITMLADHFGVSIAYMSFIFKKETGQKFSDYLWQLRMEKAQQLLTQTDMTIDAVSVEVGYLNTSSFRRKFKQETGQSPNQYRAAARGGAQEDEAGGQET